MLWVWVCCATDWGFVVELGVVIGKNGRDITEAQADSYVAGYSTYKCRSRLGRREDLMHLCSLDDRHDGTQHARRSQEKGPAVVCGQRIRYVHAYQVRYPELGLGSRLISRGARGSPFIPRDKISDPHNLKLWLKASIRPVVLRLTSH